MVDLVVGAFFLDDRSQLFECGHYSHRLQGNALRMRPLAAHDYFEVQRPENGELNAF